MFSNSLMIMQYHGMANFCLNFSKNSFLEQLYHKAKLFIILMNFSDLDECDFNASTCHSNARCSNTIGSYHCNCDTGFIGDGFNCTGNVHELYKTH